MEGYTIPNVLHIFAQRAWHDKAEIWGTKESLTRLRDALNFVLEPENLSMIQEDFNVNDGEGYHVVVRMEKEETMMEVPVPYTADYARNYKGD